MLPLRSPDATSALVALESAVRELMLCVSSCYLLGLLYVTRQVGYLGCTSASEVA